MNCDPVRKADGMNAYTAMSHALFSFAAFIRLLLAYAIVVTGYRKRIASVDAVTS